MFIIRDKELLSDIAELTRDEPNRIFEVWAGTRLTPYAIKPFSIDLSTASLSYSMYLTVINLEFPLWLSGLRT